MLLIKTELVVTFIMQVDDLFQQEQTLTPKEDPAFSMAMKEIYSQNTGLFFFYCTPRPTLIVHE